MDSSRDLDWRKTLRSQQQDACVEVAVVDD